MSGLSSSLGSAPSPAAQRYIAARLAGTGLGPLTEMEALRALPRSPFSPFSRRLGGK